MKGMGLRTRKGNPVAKSQIESMLKNSFYHGIMVTKKGIFPHIYDPIITKSLFEKVQSIFEGYHKKPHQTESIPFIFKGSSHVVTVDVP